MREFNELSIIERKVSYIQRSTVRCVKIPGSNSLLGADYKRFVVALQRLT